MIKYNFDQDMQTLHENIVYKLQKAQQKYPFYWQNISSPRCFLFPYGLPFYIELLQSIGYLMLQKSRNSSNLHVLFCIPLSLYGVSPFLLPESSETIPVFGKRFSIINPFKHIFDTSITYSDKRFHYNKFLFPHLLLLRVLFPDINITPFVFNTQYNTKYLTDSLHDVMQDNQSFVTIFHGNFTYKRSHCTEKKFLENILPRIKNHQRISSSFVDQFSLNAFVSLSKRFSTSIEQIMYVTNENIRSPEEYQKVYSLLGW